MRIGILTGGGDCPGLNNAIRAALRQANQLGHEVVGVRDGWAGLLDRDARPLTWADVEGTFNEGGTLLGTSRTNPYKSPDGAARVLRNFAEMGLDALIAIGGDDTLGVALKLTAAGVPCVGVPKTMDNDVGGTDYTIGFQTAAAIATDAAERLHTTARSHRRTLLLEVMGRDAGWVALWAGLCGGAHLTLLPEFPVDMGDVSAFVAARRDRGEPYTIIVTAEGVNPEGLAGVDYEARGRDQFGHVRLGGVGERIAVEISRRAGVETRATVLGYIQRGGPPVPFDRMLGTGLGLKAAHLVHERRFGVMAALRGEDIVAVPIADALARPKRVTPELARAVTPLLRV
jgi:6-phosphofructokinase 1